MKAPGVAASGFLLAAMALTSADTVNAAPAAPDTCQLYGYVPHTRAYSECRLNLRRYWSTGACADGVFASVHRRTCHLVPEFDF